MKVSLKKPRINNQALHLLLAPFNTQLVNQIRIFLASRFEYCLFTAKYWFGVFKSIFKNC